MFDPDGPGPAPAVPTSYTQTNGLVVDSQPRIISNLIIDPSVCGRRRDQLHGAVARHQPAGPDGMLITADDVHEHSNPTSPFVDQNQPYSSHPSHQVFLRS